MLAPALAMCRTVRPPVLVVAVELQCSSADPATTLHVLAKGRREVMGTVPVR